MQTTASIPDNVKPDRLDHNHHTADEQNAQDDLSGSTLPISITQSASKQTYYTIRFLVDRGRVLDAFRAYAYFRWVDDHIDQDASERTERIVFVERQQSLVDGGYRGEWPDRLASEERMLRDLIYSDREQDSGLQSYIRHMMAVMVFDANRRGRLITAKELDCYTHHLAVAVTDALHYFIGHDQSPPQSEARYLPATAAHITHMLRDTCEDVAAGYFNVPGEYLVSHGIDPCEVGSEPYRAWVKSQVRLARDYFAAGADYLAHVKHLRCRIAGYSYMARFAGVLDAVERDGFRLRPEYPECKSWGAMLNNSWSIITGALRTPASGRL